MKVERRRQKTRLNKKAKLVKSGGRRKRKANKIKRTKKILAKRSAKETRMKHKVKVK